MGESNRMTSRLVCICLALAALPVFAQSQRCDDISHLSLPGIAIRSATPVGAGVFGPGNIAPRAVPAFCRVIATVT